LSPDGRFVAFVTDDKLKKVALAGGSPVTLADSYMPSAPAWAPGDTIIYSLAYNSGLARISAEGGSPVTLTTPDPSQGELGHWHPFLLPDGQSLLFTVWTRGGLPATKIALLDLRTGKYRFLVTGGFGGRYAASGHLVYARPGALMAAPFDVSRGALTGEPVPVIEGLDVDPSNAAPYFSIGGDGTLLYLAAGAAANRIMWAEAAARPLPITEEKRGFQYPAVSPDGRRIAVSVYEEGSADLWLLEPARGVLTRLTSSPRLEFMPRCGPQLVRGAEAPGPYRARRIWKQSVNRSMPMAIEVCTHFPVLREADGTNPQSGSITQVQSAVIRPCRVWRSP